MTWTIETGSTPALWDVYDEDGNRIARDKTRGHATLIASAPQLAEENEALRAMLREWFVSGAKPLENLVERTRAALSQPTWDKLGI